MNLLVLNPNTTATMTDAVVERVRALSTQPANVRGATASFGFPVIDSRAAFAVAGHAALDTWAREREPIDAIMVACFGDPGVAALRELSLVPTVGLAEASIRSALRRSGRFAIVTAGQAWKPMLGELVATVGASASLAEIVVLEGNGLDFASQPAAASQRLRDAVDGALDRGATSVILGGAGFARIAATWDAREDVIDCIAAATRELMDAAAMPAAGSVTSYPSTIGLHPDLAARFAAR